MINQILLTNIVVLVATLVCGYLMKQVNEKQVEVGDKKLYKDSYTFVCLILVLSMVVLPIIILIKIWM